MSEQYLGFDYGKQRIGVAVGNSLTRTAKGLGIIQSHPKPDWKAIQVLLDEWRPQACIVGLPLNMDGSEQDITKAVRKFATALEQHSGVPSHTMDERLSSVAAKESLKQQRSSGRKKRIRKEEKDSEAARVILEDWLNQ